MKKTGLLFSIFVSILLLSCSLQEQPATPTIDQSIKQTSTPAVTSTAASPIHYWWNDAVFYEIKVRSFSDSDGDGIGDINGITEKLDYLNDGDPATQLDLGITGIWLMPFFESPSTHGYNITDFYAIDPDLGTMDDFKRLLEECHTRGIKVIIDLIIHNTSKEHPWFVQSQDPQSPYRDWYVWEDTDPGFRGPWGQQVWFPSSSGYYRAYFGDPSPDLNAANPEVIAELYKITNFWLNEIGVDGFRLDAIGKLISEGEVLVETAATHAWLKEYYSYIQSIAPHAMTIAEVWTPDSISAPYVVNHETNLAFDFDLSFAIRNSINNGNNIELLKVLREGTGLFPAGQYGLFLTNHDMERTMKQFGGDIGKAKAAAALYLTMPGVPFIFYGEEIGLNGDFNQVGPMQWSPGVYAGWSSFDPARQTDNELRVDANYQAVNVESEQSMPDTLLGLYRSLIRLRSEHPALRSLDMTVIPSGNPAIFASLRQEDEEAVIIIVNLSAESVSTYNLSLYASSLIPGIYHADSLIGRETPLDLNVGENGAFDGYLPVSEIPPYGTLILLLAQ